MELEKSFDLRRLLIGLYFVAFAVFVVVGFMPAEAATSYEKDTTLVIPTIGLESDVTKVKLEQGKLSTPERIVGSFSRRQNKTLLIGHESTVFGDLDELRIGDELNYAGNEYVIVDVKMMRKEDVNMRSLLKSAEVDTVVLMTCAGENLDNGDATHRLIITATAL